MLTSTKRRPARTFAPLMLVVFMLSSCTINMLDNADDHDHEPGAAEHDHSEEASGIDHHGNPIFDEDERVYEQVTGTGVSVEFTVETFLGVGGRGGELAPRLIEGEHANLQFHIVDETGAPMSGLSPAVWVDPDVGDVSCGTRIEGYLSGTIDRRPAIDLNSYFILGMNRDSTISVIDPMINVGGMTNLFSVIILQAPADDWAMVEQASRLFATMPDLDRVAVVDLEAFLVEDNIDLPGTPEAIYAEPGGRRVWITLADGAGVAVVDTETLDARALDVGPVTPALAFDSTGNRVFIGTPEGVAVMDSNTQEEIGRSPTTGPAAAVAISVAHGDVYVTQSAAGIISIIDVATSAETGYLQVQPGVAAIEFSADGEWGVAVNPDAESAYVIEAGQRHITHQIPVAGTPDQVLFTEAAAYIHTSGSPSVTAIPLDEIDPGGNVSVLTIPIGSQPSGQNATSLKADAITVLPDGRSLLLPNPADDTVYFYVEGSESAAGGFQGHTLQPSAVQVVDRSLKEPSPGVYTGSIRIPQEGEFVVAFLLGEPELTHCFSFTARAADDPPEGVETTAAELKILTDPTVTAGARHELRFEIRDRDTGTALAGLRDVFAIVSQTGGSWNMRTVAESVGDGVYSMVVTPPRAGVYRVLFTIPSLGLDFESLPQLSLTATS